MASTDASGKIPRSFPPAANWERRWSSSRMFGSLPPPVGSSPRCPPLAPWYLPLPPPLPLRPPPGGPAEPGARTQGLYSHTGGGGGTGPKCGMGPLQW
eukprot:1480785-Pyramimonas_sp.AAC.1